MVLRVHERFGVRPFSPEARAWWDAMTTAEQSTLLANERIRQTEEAWASTPPVKP